MGHYVSTSLAIPVKSSLRALGVVTGGARQATVWHGNTAAVAAVPHGKLDARGIFTHGEKEKLESWLLCYRYFVTV